MRFLRADFEERLLGLLFSAKERRIVAEAGAELSRVLPRHEHDDSDDGSNAQHNQSPRSAGQRGARVSSPHAVALAHSGRTA